MNDVPEEVSALPDSRVTVVAAMVPGNAWQACWPACLSHRRAGSARGRSEAGRM